MINLTARELLFMPMGTNIQAISKMGYLRAKERWYTRMEMCSPASSSEDNQMVRGQQSLAMEPNSQVCSKMDSLLCSGL
jgi:hypothetical protein